MGSATIKRLVNITKKFSFHGTGEGGKATAPTKKSIQKIMRYEDLNGEKLWLVTIQNENGSVTGHFFSVLGGVRTYIDIANWI